MRLFIMRHGPAESGAPTRRDFDRELTASGRTRTEQAARDLTTRFDAALRILASPLVRARQTAEIVAAVVGRNSRVESSVELAPGGDAASLVASLLEKPDEYVLLVSHAPLVSELTCALTGNPMGSFSAAMIVGLDVGAGRATRRFVIDPE